MGRNRSVSTLCPRCLEAVPACESKTRDHTCRGVSLHCAETSCLIRSSSFLGKPDTEDNRASFVATVPLGRGTTPDDVANACCYLASDEASFVTGVNLEVG